jgi:starch-binding outer membrane protein, SusD/RagB family
MKTKHQIRIKAIHIVTVACTLTILVLTAGCDRDFPNPNAPIVEDVTIQTLVTGTEAGMRIDYAIYLRAVSIIGREAYYFEPADPRYTGELLIGTPDPGGFLLLRPWTARYRVIANCNFLIEKAEELPSAERAGIIGYANTVIAYQLMLNLNYLDENGIKLDFTGSTDAPFVPKNAALIEIARLLDEAYTNLQAAGQGFPFRLSSGFSADGFDTPEGFGRFNRALRARVAVYQGEFSTALTLLEQSFLITDAGQLDLGVYHVYSSGAGDQTNEIYESPTLPFVKYMGHPSFQTDAEPGDTRFSSKVAVRSEATTFDFLTSRLAVTTTRSSIDRLPIIRNEELLLLRAEAYIGTEQYGAAEQDINLIRSAAGLGSVSLTPQNAVDLLLHERRYSLFLEGHRWIDMRRYDRLNELPLDRGGDVVVAMMPRPETE